MDRQSLPRRVGRSISILFAAITALAVASSALAAGAHESATGRKPFAGKMTPDQRHPLLEAWKASKGSTDAPRAKFATGGTPVVGRASMVINSAGSVAYTQNWLGDTTNNCEIDLGNPLDWNASVAYQSGDYVRNTAHDTVFMATNSGTSGASEPPWNTAFGVTTSGDGGVTWKSSGNRDWQSGLAYTVGMVVHPSAYFGFSFQVTSVATLGDLSGGTEPHWPTTPGATVNDNGITWKAIGLFPGSFRGCNPMSMAIRSSGGGTTVIAKEGDAVGTAQLYGWGEFIAMNNSGKVAFKSGIVDVYFDNDETGAAIFQAGPGAGQLQKIAQSGDTIGGVNQCGFATMVGMNNSSQVVFNGYSYRPGNTWQAAHSYGANACVIPTAPNGRNYCTSSGGTSGGSEPAFPTAVNDTVVDGSVTWTMNDGRRVRCDEDNHSLIRFTPGTGNELLTHIGASIGGSTVQGFGADFYNGTGTTNCNFCSFNDIPGLINATGNVPIVLNLADGTQGVFNFTGPNAATQVARTGSTYAVFYPRVTSNNSNQVVFKAAVSAGAFWQPGQTYAVGDFVFPRPSNGSNQNQGPNGIRYQAQSITTGTSASTPPVWPTTIGTPVVDGGVTWVADELSPDQILRFTPPSTTVTIVTVGDDVGTRTVGVANGVTFQSFGNFFDFNNSGNVVFQAKLSGTQEGYYFWNGATGNLSEVLRQADTDSLASEMITVNDSNLVAYVTGNDKVGNDDGDDDHSEDFQSGGAFFWKNGTTQKAIAVGDVVGGNTVTSVYAQHQSFVRRQLSEAGCLALNYNVNGDDPGFDNEEGDTTKGGQLFISCFSNSCPTILLSPPTLPGGADGVAYNQTITATGGVAPYTYAVTSGSTGALNLSSSGVISGSPSGTGTLSFTVTATDSNGCTASQAYSIVVGSSSQTNLTISPTALQTIVVGGMVTYTVTISNPQKTDTVITLTSSDPSIGTVPASVTILADQTTATFNATGVAPGGPITITASLPGGFEAPPATDFLVVVQGQVVSVPTLGGFGLLLLGLAVAAAGWRLLRL
ncbi:MAG: putative Ig domain-containing protein [Thermoanaerobaculia bacterium]